MLGQRVRFVKGGHVMIRRNQQDEYCLFREGSIYESNVDLYRGGVDCALGHLAFVPHQEYRGRFR